jgi:hypothetical protein
MGDSGDHDQHVEDLVIAECGRQRVGPPARVNDGPGGVGDAAGRQQRQRADAGALDDLRHGHQAEPAERYVRGGRQPLRRPGPYQGHHDPGQRPAPDTREHDRAKRAIQHEQRKWRVGAGNQHEDHRVV